nr:hypothetical protein [Niveispirillum lacus]
MVAILASVLNEPLPGPTRLDGGPKISKGLFWHVRMAHHVVGGAEEFILSKPANADKRLIDESDAPAGIRPRYQDLISGQIDFTSGYRSIVPHKILSP